MKLKDFKIGDFVMWEDINLGHKAGKIVNITEKNIIIKVGLNQREYHQPEEDVCCFDKEKAIRINMLWHEKNDLLNQYRKKIKDILNEDEQKTD